MINQSCFSDKNRENGMALITVILVGSLVVGLILMALTNSRMGSLLTSGHLKSKTAFSCAEGDLDTVTQLFQERVDLSVNTPNITFNADLVAEYHGTLIVDDVLDPTPNIVITDPDHPGCATSVDIDFLGKKRPDDTVPDESPGQGDANDGYAHLVLGTACIDGDYYSIVAVTTGPNGYQSRVQSFYYQCGL